MYLTSVFFLVYTCTTVHTGSIPRYVRINRIKTSIEDVILDFEQNNFEQVQLKSVQSFVAQVGGTRRSRVVVKFCFSVKESSQS